MDTHEEFEDYDGGSVYDGNLNFAILTSYTDNVAGSGIVWVVQTDDKDSGFALVSGLERPVNACFDKHNHLLYVVDAATDDQGFIYQYDITWDGDETFELTEDTYTLVYQGSAATDCTTDRVGNLYFATVDNHIYGISYVDLYKRVADVNQELLDETSIAGCTGIDIRDDGEILFANNENVDTLGTLVGMYWYGAELLDDKEVKIQLTAGSAKTIATSWTDIYYTSANKLFDYNYETEASREIARNFVRPSSIAFGGDEVWVADNGTGYVYRF